jgi:hypothetical protein
LKFQPLYPTVLVDPFPAVDVRAGSSMGLHDAKAWLAHDIDTMVLIAQIVKRVFNEASGFGGKARNRWKDGS